MARYNSKRIYNRIIPSGGARYNSAPFSINIFDYSKNIVDNIKNVTRNTNIQDSNKSRVENISFGFSVNVKDNILTLEKINLSIDTGTRIDLGHGQEIINNQANGNYSDTGRGNDNINLSPLMLLLNELSKHTDNINIHPLTIALSQTLNINETINFDTVLLEFIDNINSSENTLFDSNINIEDNSQGSDNLSQIISNILTNELGNGVEVINLLPLSINITDNNLTANETTSFNSIIIYSDNGSVTDILSLPLMQVDANDNLSLNDLVNVEFSDINLVDNAIISNLIKINNDIFLNDENISAIDFVVYRSGVFYNTKLQYNRKLNDNGANYNSSKHLIIIVSESGSVDEAETYVVQAYFVYDNGQGNDNSNITNELPKLFDNGISADSFKNITNNVTVIDLSKLDFKDEATFSRIVDVIDKIIANDYVRKAETHFIVDSDNILQPLGIKVAKVSEGILPFTKDYTEEIPGMHGEYYLKSELKGKAIEFEVVTPDGLTSEVKNELKRKITEYLNPTKNVEKPLTFSEDLEKQYLVRYSGNIDIDNYPSWFKFVIPFKMSNPLIRGSFDNVLIGNGTITNKGNTDANMIININGLADNPTIELDGQILTYNGTIEYGQTVVINTEKKTVMMDGINVLDNWCGIFPTLKPGETNVTMNGNISIRWRDSWL